MKIRITTEGFYDSICDKTVSLLKGGDILEVKEDHKLISPALCEEFNAEATFDRKAWGIYCGKRIWVPCDCCEIIS